jgi:hypothetical protein
MARANAGERLAALETELPHVRTIATETRDEMRGAVAMLSKEMAAIRVTLARYAQTGLLLATAGLVNAVSTGSSAFAAEVLKVALGVLVK